MGRYLLDTCALIWILSEDKRIEKFAEGIHYFQGDYAVSIESLKELLYLSASGKLHFDVDWETIKLVLKESEIKVLLFDEYSLSVLNALPYYQIHPDPVDRQIIAHAIADHRTLISGDKKFSLYKDLRVIEI